MVRQRQTPLVNLALGVRFIGAAWEARGMGTSDQVNEERARLFFKRLQIAEQFLQQAGELDAEGPLPWAYRIAVARGLQYEKSVGLEYFQEARTRDPENRVAFKAMLTNLCWKWGGSHQTMFAFARKMSQEAPEGSWVHRMFVDAHSERYLAFRMQDELEGQS